MIFLDLDGVCCDFVGHFLKLADRTEAQYVALMRERPELTPYEALRQLVGAATDADQWALIRRMGGMGGENWWATIPAYPWFADLYDRLKDLGTVKFLTSAPACSSAHHGKARWIERHVGRDALHDLIICRAEIKHLLAGLGRVLIDDHPDNVHAWRQANGASIQFPTIQFTQCHPTRDDIDRVVQLARSVMHPLWAVDEKVEV